MLPRHNFVPLSTLKKRQGMEVSIPSTSRCHPLRGTGDGEAQHRLAIPWDTTTSRLRICYISICTIVTLCLMDSQLHQHQVPRMLATPLSVPQLQAVCALHCFGSLSPLWKCRLSARVTCGLWALKSCAVFCRQRLLRSFISE
eukprot:3131754-Amphidinium_carterae.1